MRSLLYRGRSFDPYENLAVEEALLAVLPADSCLLYLWQNAHTVVIGKNQNALKECRVALLEREGGRLARRSTGGGAVYHDLGNLNFTFLATGGVYDVTRQNRVLLRALQTLGIPAELSGRNDLLADGRKFSGHAFLREKDRACHHGTLMVDVDTDRVQRYLSPPQAKLEAKGVDSVRARVVNLRELAPNLTVQRLAEAVTAAFFEAYGVAEEMEPAQLDAALVSDLRARNESAAWRFGNSPPMTAQCEGRFSWGGADLRLSVAKGRIRACRLYTDAMDETLAQRVEQALTGAACTPQALAQALEPIEVRTDLMQLLEGCF